MRAHVEGLDESISDYDVLTQKVEVWHILCLLCECRSHFLKYDPIDEIKIMTLQALAAEVMELLDGTSLYLVGMMGR